MKTFASDNKDKIKEWEEEMEVRLKNDALQRIGKGGAAEELRKKAIKKAKIEKMKKKKKLKYIETRRLEREKAEQEEAVSAENEAQMEEVVRRELAARKGLAFAASRFNNVLVKNEEKRKKASRELTLLATIATAEVLKTMRTQKALKKDLDPSASPGVAKLRRTLVQQHQDNLINRMVQKGKATTNRRNSRTDASARTRSSANDYLESSLQVMAGLSSRHLLVDGDSSKFGNAGVVTCRGGANAYDQPKLMERERVRMRSFVEGEVEIAGQFRYEDCRVDMEVVSDEDVLVTVKVGGEIGTLELRQRVPMLVIVERDAAMSYASSFIQRLRIVRRVKRVVRLGEVVEDGWMPFALEIEDGADLI